MNKQIKQTFMRVDDKFIPISSICIRQNERKESGMRDITLTININSDNITIGELRDIFDNNKVFYVYETYDNDDTKVLCGKYDMKYKNVKYRYRSSCYLWNVICTLGAKVDDILEELETEATDTYNTIIGLYEN